MATQETRELPQELDKEFEKLAKQGLEEIQRRNFLYATATFKYLYETLKIAQQAGVRYHKGFPLHNWAIAQLLARQPEGALRLFLMAFVEDALTQPKSQEGEARQTPAGRVVALIYRVNSALLEAIETIAKGSKPRNVPGDPEEVLKKAFNETGLSLNDVASTDFQLAARSIDNLESEWHKRVFIGGDYSSKFAEIQEIAEEVARWGFDPIIASEFKIREDLVHHHTLMLLHNCKLAIFDISSDAGHLVEIKRLRDYGVLPLMVYSKHPTRDQPRVSSMISTLINHTKYSSIPYSNTTELRRHVEAFLDDEIRRAEPAVEA